MGCDSPKVDAANARNWRLSVEASGPWKRGDDFERLFELLSEYVQVVAIGQPPGLLPPNVLLRSGCEANASILQRDRSSRRITSASMRRPASMSSSESFRARWRAARSSSSSQSPGSRGSSSISVPSGRSVGSSTTSRPDFTRAFSVMAITVASRSVAQQASSALHRRRWCSACRRWPGRHDAGIPEPLPWRCPNSRNRGIVRKSSCRRSVRDRGVGGSNPPAPTNRLSDLGPVVLTGLFLFATKLPHRRAVVLSPAISSLIRCDMM